MPAIGVQYIGNTDIYKRGTLFAVSLFPVANNGLFVQKIRLYDYGK